MVTHHCCVFSDLDAAATSLVYSGLRYNTNRTYSSAQKTFFSFCHQFNLCPAPASEKLLLWFIAYMNVRGLSCASLKVYLSAIRSWHVMNGMQIPPINAPRVKLALKAIFEAQPPVSQKAPITYDILSKLMSIMGNSYDDLVWKAVLTMAFYGALRGAEYAVQVNGSGISAQMTRPLLVSDVQFGIHPNGITYYILHIHQSKTKPHGFQVPIGCSQSAVCSVCTMIAYLSARRGRFGLKPQAPLFMFADRTFLNKSMLRAKIKSLVASLKLDPSKYSPHSLRSGAASSAGMAGFADWEIQSLGGWASDTYRTYVRHTELHRVGFAKRLANNNIKV